jgi:outer membrane protein
MTTRHALLWLPALVATLVLGTAWADDLLSIYRLALERDPTLKAADQQRLATLQAKPQARALLLPNLSVTGNISRNSFNPTHNPAVYFTNQNYALQLTQPLYHRDYWVQLSEAGNQIAQAQANYVAAEQDLISRVASAYFNVLKSESALEAVLANKEATARQLEQAKQRFDVGLVAITDVQNAQAQYDAAAAQEIVARNDLARAREAVAEITGEEPGTMFDLAEKIPLTPPQPSDMQKWVDWALAQNPQVIAGQFAVKVAHDNVEVQRSGHYPTLDLVGTYGYEDASTGGLFSLQGQDGSIGLQLNIPIYSGGAVVSRTRQASHQMEQAKDQLQASQRATVRQARNAYRAVLDTISEVKAQKQAVVSAETSLEATEAGYEVGTRTIVDVLNSQQSLYQHRLDYATARYNHILARLALKLATGQLSETDVADVNRLLTAPKAEAEGSAAGRSSTRRGSKR